jgi:IMP cyclohydrolase
MYVGRIVGIGRTADGGIVAGYRISSRSFPNRTAERFDNSVRIVARPGSADAASDSPYIAYDCLLWNARYLVAGNGTQTRPIFDRLCAGYSLRDALAGVLSGLDREFDAYDTPRISAAVDIQIQQLYLGSVTADALSIVPVETIPGRFAYITTYEFPLPLPSQAADLNGRDADSICRQLIDGPIFGGFDHPVCATAAVVDSDGFKLAIRNDL